MQSEPRSQHEKTKNMVHYIYENIEKPLIIPTENYINQQMNQLQALDIEMQNESQIHQKMSFEDVLSNLPDDIHYRELESLISNHFGLDQMASSIIVTHLLHRNDHFVCVKKEQVLDAICPDRETEEGQ
jgi:hypothetical protein